MQISQSDCNDGLYTVAAVASDHFTVSESIDADRGALCTKVVYPPDVKLGAANLIKWGIDNRDKAGVASETISRHSVSYVSLDDSNSALGYPKALVAFLKPYRKARF